MSLKSGFDFSDIFYTLAMMHRTSDDSKILRQFSEHLRTLRLERCLTQEELAAKAGFSRSYYNEIETGKRNISLLNLAKLARCLEVPLSELLHIEGEHL
jgi:DNA-binding XRE family transcriptional regulator